MARLFLDANYFFDLVEKRREIDKKQFVGHHLYISHLSLAILAYLYKHKMPSKKFSETFNTFTKVPLVDSIGKKALDGPTRDYEDNIQLHSAAEAECDYFITNEKSLWKIKFFGKVNIVPEAPAESR